MNAQNIYDGYKESAQRQKLLAQLKDAFVAAIREIGLKAFKATSMFGRNN